MPQLTDLPDVGETTAQTLRDAGYGDVSTVAKQGNPVTLAETVTRWDEEQAAEAIQYAWQVHPDAGRGPPPKDPVEDLETRIETTDTRVPMSRYELYQLQHVVLEEATKQRQRNAHDEMLAAYDVARLIGDTIATVEASEHNDIGFPIPADETLQLSLQRACGRGISDYRSRQGISVICTPLDQVKTTISEIRSE